jgi:crotonobetainyl-CoA:carnitine CoA-transferase CaiB-like acyl-CoA transferase
VQGLHEALTSKRATDAGLVTSQPHPDAGSTHVLAPPYRFDGTRMPVRNPPQQLGTDTAAVLGHLLGLSDEELVDLKTKGVI